MQRLIPPYRVLLLTAAALAASVLVAPGAAVGTSALRQQGAAFTCDGTFHSRTFENVKVEEGDTCILIDSTVTGDFTARNPRTVKVLDTPVERNLMVRGATHDVVIGNAGCKVDPAVGNNIEVSKSHNVSICWMTTKNNIQVTGNDGRIGLFHNNAGRNISVSRNLAFNHRPGDGQHAKPGAIRLRHNQAQGQINLFNNERDGFRLKDNSPKPVIK